MKHLAWRKKSLAMALVGCAVAAPVWAQEAPAAVPPPPPPPADAPVALPPKPPPPDTAHPAPPTIGVPTGAVPVEETPRHADVKPTPEPHVTAGPDGFSLTSADKLYQLKIRGLLQVDDHFFTEGKDKPGNNTLFIRRAQPLFAVTAGGWVDFQLLLDLSSGAQTVQDGFVDIHPLSEVRLRVGKFRSPLGLERLRPAAALEFPEFGLATNLTPNRDLGLQVSGDFGKGTLTYAVGVFNGVADGAISDFNVDDNVDLIGRLFAHPLRPSGIDALKGLGVGFAASRGAQHGTLAASSVGALRTAGQQTYFSYLTGATLDTTVVASGEHLRIAPQGYYYYGPFGLLAEYVSTTQEVARGADKARLTNAAFQGEVSFVLFGGKAAYEGVHPVEPVDPSAGHWGALEIAARYNTLKVDPNAFPLFADPDRSASRAQGGAVAVHWYLNGNTRITVSGERTAFEGGGTGGTNRPTEMGLFSRFQASW